MAGVEDTSVGLLGAVADTLMPGVRIVAWRNSERLAGELGK